MKGELLLIEGLDIENNTVKIPSWFKDSANNDITPTPELVNQYINLVLKSGDNFEITKDDILRNIKIYKTKYESREKISKKHYKNNDKFNYITQIIQGSKDFAILNLLTQAYNVYDLNYNLAKDFFLNAHIGSEIPLPITFTDNGVDLEINFDSELLGIGKVVSSDLSLGTTSSTTSTKTSSSCGGSGFDKSTIPAISAGVMQLLGTLIGLASDEAGSIVSSTSGLSCSVASGLTNTSNCNNVDCSQYNQSTNSSTEESTDELLSTSTTSETEKWYESPYVWVGAGAFLLITILLLTRK